MVVRALSKLSFELPEDFQPSEYDVVCSWARQNFTTAGNIRLREIITKNTLAYKKAKSKIEKGKIIDGIVSTIVSASPSKTGFVKRDKTSGRWRFIGLDKAKDKVGHALRQAAKDRLFKKCKQDDADSSAASSVASAASDKASRETKRTRAVLPSRSRVHGHGYMVTGAAHSPHHPYHQHHLHPHHHPSYAQWYSAYPPHPPPQSMEYYRNHAHHMAAPSELRDYPSLGHSAASNSNCNNTTLATYANDTIEKVDETQSTSHGRRLSTSSLPSLRHESPPHNHHHHHHQNLPHQHQQQPQQLSPPSHHPYPYNRSTNGAPEYLPPHSSTQNNESSSINAAAPPRGSPTSVIREAHTSYMTPTATAEDHGKPREDPEKYPAAMGYHSPAHAHVAAHAYPPHVHYAPTTAAPLKGARTASPSLADGTEPSTHDDEAFDVAVADHHHGEPLPHHSDMKHEDGNATADPQHPDEAISQYHQYHQQYYQQHHHQQHHQHHHHYALVPPPRSH